MLFKKNAEPNKRIAFVMLSFETSFSLDIMKTHLREFTWGGTSPDDTLAGIVSLGVRATF
jgi:hypothetical protein